MMATSLCSLISLHFFERRLTAFLGHTDTIDSVSNFYVLAVNEYTLTDQEQPTPFQPVDSILTKPRLRPTPKVRWLGH